MLLCEDAPRRDDRDRPVLLAEDGVLFSVPDFLSRIWHGWRDFCRAPPPRGALLGLACGIVRDITANSGGGRDDGVRSRAERRRARCWRRLVWTAGSHNCQAQVTEVTAEMGDKAGKTCSHLVHLGVGHADKLYHVAPQDPLL